MKSFAQLALWFAVFVLPACLNDATHSFITGDSTDVANDPSLDSHQDVDAGGEDVAMRDLADDFGIDQRMDPLTDPDLPLDEPDTGADVLADAWVDADVEPDPPAVFSFAVFGDNQFSVSSCTSGNPERLAVPQVVLDLEPTLVVHTGDLMDHGYEDGAYAHFVDCYDDMLATLPFFPTGGNHDFGGGAITAYKAYLEEQLFERNPLAWVGDYEADFAIAYEDDTTDWSTDRDNPSDRSLLPSGVTWKTYYAFRYLNAYFISFEQGTRWWTQTPKPWLEQHLIAASTDPSIDHIFVTMHHPMYSAVMPETDDSECIEPVRRHYEDLFRQYDVDIVFSGHVHSYDRFYVPDDGTPTRQSPPPAVYPNDGNGVHYIVTGGGGGGLTNRCNPFPLRQEHSYQYSQSRGCFHHVTFVEVEGGRLSVTVISVDGGETDYVTAVEDTFVIE